MYNHVELCAREPHRQQQQQAAWRKFKVHLRDDDNSAAEEHGAHYRCVHDACKHQCASIWHRHKHTLSRTQLLYPTIHSLGRRKKYMYMRLHFHTKQLQRKYDTTAIRLTRISFASTTVTKRATNLWHLRRKKKKDTTTRKDSQWPLLKGSAAQGYKILKSKG